MKNEFLIKIRNKMLLPIWYMAYAWFFIVGCFIWIFSDLSFKSTTLLATAFVRDIDWRKNEKS